MPAHYGLLVGRPIDKKEAQSEHDHYQILVNVDSTDESIQGKYRAAIDVHSKVYPSEVQFVVNESFTSNIDALAGLSDGVYTSKGGDTALTLDYVRQNLFPKDSMRPLPIFSEPDGKDLNDQLDDFIESAMADQSARLFLFGQLFQDNKPDPVFPFNPGRGIHDVHMNQGNVADFSEDDGIYEDGGVVIHFGSTNKWVGIFLKFQSQTWNTDQHGHRTDSQKIAPGHFTAATQTAALRAKRSWAAGVQLGASVPKTILLLRHAEKPFDSSNPNLSPEGYDRAEELATFIPDKWGKPDFIFASEISRHSARPIETMKPLSKATGIKIDHEYADQDYEALAQLILTNQEYDGALIVICWHHNNIPGLAQALNANTKVPSPWDATVFDLIVDIEYGAKSSSPKVKLVTQNFAAKV